MAKGYTLDERSYLKLREVVAWWDRWKVQLISLLVPGRRNKPGGGGGGNAVKRAKTQEAAQADLLISVKLLDAEGAVYDDAFDAKFISTDGCTAANAALPRVQTAKTILVSRVGGTWYVVNPTITDSEACP